MCNWANPGSKIRQSIKERESRAVSLCYMLLWLLESMYNHERGEEEGDKQAGTAKADSYQKFEGMCRRVSQKSIQSPQTLRQSVGSALKSANDGSASDVLDLPSFIEVFERLGLQFPVAEAKILHDYFSGHYPTLTQFLREGNVDRVESELYLLMREFKSRERTLDDAFSFFDKNGDGHISVSEFRDALKELNFDTELHERELNTLLRRFKVPHANLPLNGDNSSSNDKDEVRIDYSDFLDHFGEYDDYLRSQATCADIVIFMESLVARGVHHREHGRIDQSHARSVHSPIHLASIMSNNRRPNRRRVLGRKVTI